MKKNLALSFCIALSGILFFACNDDKKPAQTDAAKPAMLESVKVEKKQGDCKDVANEESKCAEVKLSYPTVKEGGEGLKKAVGDWSLIFMAGLLDPSLEPDKIPTAFPLTPLSTVFSLFINNRWKRCPMRPLITPWRSTTRYC